MRTVRVKSSNIAEIGYDADRHELRLVFKNGSTHDYVDVPPQRYAGLMSAESHGKYFNEHIKPHHASMKAGGPAPLMEDKPKSEPEAAIETHDDPVSALNAAARRFRMVI